MERSTKGKRSNEKGLTLPYSTSGVTYSTNTWIPDPTIPHLPYSVRESYWNGIFLSFRRRTTRGIPSPVLKIPLSSDPYNLKSTIQCRSRGDVMWSRTQLTRFMTTHSFFIDEVHEERNKGTKSRFRLVVG